MLQNLRDNLKGVAAFVLVGIISIPFVLVGVDSLFVSGGSVEQVAEVNGEKISRFEFDRALQLRKQQLVNRFGEIDPSFLNDDLLREPVLQNMIDQKVLEQAARANGMDVSTVEALRLLQDIDEFKVDGKFDPQQYEYAIRRVGLTPTAHLDSVRAEVLRNQFLLGVTLSSLVTEDEVARLASITNEKRDYYYLTIPGKPLLDTIKLSEDELLAYYQNNTANYMSEENVIVEYIDMQLADYSSEVVVDEDVLEEAYQNRLNNLTATQTKKVAHILLEKGQDDQAEELLAKIAAGEDFAELAKQFSIDSGTASQGGDLGYVAQGDLPDEMAQAVDALAVGDVSPAVTTDDGIHLIKVTAARDEELPSLDDLRAELTDSLKLQGARDLFIEAVTQLADLAYNAPLLSETADSLGLDVKTSSPFPRNGGGGIAALPEVVNAAYSDDVLIEGYPSEVLEIGDDRAIVIRVVEHNEAAVKPFEAVKEQVTTAAIEQQKNTLLDEQGLQLISQAQQGESLEALAKEAGYNWQVSLDTKRIGGNVNAQIRDFVFSLERPADKPTTQGFINRDGDFVVVSLTKVTPGELSELTPEQLNGITASSRLASSERELLAIRKSLSNSADIELN